MTHRRHRIYALNRMKLPAELLNRAAPALHGSKVCVTGGAGFIGGHLLEALLLPQIGVSQVAVLDDLSNSTLSHVADLMEVDPERVRFIHGSILDDDALAAAMEGCRVVFHLAAVGSVPRSLAHPQRTWSVNATGTVRVLEAARRFGVGRVVHSSSSSVYGEGMGATTDGPRVESQPLRPLSPYAASKVAAEAAVGAWSRSYDCQAFSLRYFNVVGPRQRANSAYAAVVPAFASAMLGGGRPAVYGDGQQARDFTPVANVVAANLLAAAAPLSATLTLGLAMNIGTGRATSVLELAAMIATRTSRMEVQPVFHPARMGEIRNSLADISLARAAIGYEPIATLEEALDETVASYRAAGVGSGQPADDPLPE